MRRKCTAPLYQRSAIALLLATSVIPGCASRPCLRSDDATRICERLYDSQQLRGERQAAVTACYKTIHDEIGLTEPPTPTR